MYILQNNIMFDEKNVTKWHEWQIKINQHLKKKIVVLRETKGSLVTVILFFFFLSLKTRRETATYKILAIS